MQLISDNGVTDFYGDGTPAKRLPVPNHKKSRSDRVALGGVVIPQPVIVSARRKSTWFARPQNTAPSRPPTRTLNERRRDHLQADPAASARARFNSNRPARKPRGHVACRTPIHSYK